VIVLDTHVLLWWLGPISSRLSPRATALIEDGLRDDSVVASSISAWEIAMLVAKGKLELSVDVLDWLDAAADTEGFRFIPVDNAVAVESQRLPGDFHPDPADRMIVALARQLGATLVTADAKIARYPHVTSAW
jgi:PIN domain nuclease of toxin-antitoxin system